MPWYDILMICIASLIGLLITTKLIIAIIGLIIAKIFSPFFKIIQKEFGDNHD